MSLNSCYSIQSKFSSQLYLCYGWGQVICREVLWRINPLYYPTQQDNLLN